MGLVGQLVRCCVVKHGLVTLVVIKILKDTAAFQVLFTVSLFCAWNITAAEINSGDAFIHKKLNPPLFTSGGLGLNNLVLFTSLTLRHVYDFTCHPSLSLHLSVVT